jgi:hypothetical protein
MTKDDKKRVLTLLSLAREYIIDVIAMGQLKADAIIHNNDQFRMQRIYQHQGELQERIQSAEIELISEIAKYV